MKRYILSSSSGQDFSFVFPFETMELLDLTMSSVDRIRLDISIRRNRQEIKVGSREKVRWTRSS